MSIDWLPEEDRRRFPDNVYTEPCWTRTDKGILYNSKRDLKNLYDIFEIYKKKGRVLAEGILIVITKLELWLLSIPFVFSSIETYQKHGLIFLDNLYKLMIDDRK